MLLVDKSNKIYSEVHSVHMQYETVILRHTIQQ